MAIVTYLQNSHSFVKCDEASYYAGHKGSEWSEKAKCVLVLALAHELSDLVIDIPAVAE
jgi:hypothetical protein